jgi:hypothetical protein
VDRALRPRADRHPVRLIGADGLGEDGSPFESEVNRHCRFEPSARCLTSAERARRASSTYGLGTGEVGVGRGEIPLLAARSHRRGPKDIAPAGYKTDAPESLFDLASAPIGRRRSATRSRRSR